MKEKLKRLRKEHGLTQENLAEKLHVSRQTISNWENGNTLPDIENLKLLSQYYHVPLSFLFTEKEETCLPLERLNKDLKKFLLFLSIASFITPLASFVLLYFLIEEKTKLSMKFYKTLFYFALTISLVNILFILFFSIDNLFLIK
ncbi:transcriptional regulator [Enterococcus villorum]|uniref:Transcriptional regulator n=1 Tax=Enterococcus villorum TaxID=112904 RepID=A0A1V8YU47_9ENTE|nr:helix-turn-helix transcriptional regulator [Enterococcus villorum]OQO69042.1 transcriptional regulator [Enterococcus villorum]OQO76135.1 transcriptional regulator [Enterococcus villorum]